MNTIVNLLGDLRNVLGCIGELLAYFLRFVSMFFRCPPEKPRRLCQNRAYGDLAFGSQLGYLPE